VNVCCGIGEADLARFAGGQILEIVGSLKSSALDAPRAERARNAEEGATAFKQITAELYG